MISNIKELASMNWFECIILIVLVMLIWKGFIELVDWFFKRYGIETKKMKEKREDHELLVKTTQNLVLLQEKSEKDDRCLEALLRFLIFSPFQVEERRK